jgi:1,4-dihydroxy-2-naphthoate octaprenyltransferase
MNTITFWFQAARKVALPQSILPAITAVCMASAVNSFSLALGVLGIVGVALAHLGMNLFDDYFDFRKKGAVGIRHDLAGAGFRSRLGKCTPILEGETTARGYLIAACTFCGLAILIGLIIIAYRGSCIWWFIGIGGFLGVFYAGYPFRLGYHGLGEVVIGLMFGPLLMGGVYYAACGETSPTVWILSASVGMLVANIVYTHAIMDYEPDRQIGKKTLAVLLGNAKAMLTASALLIFLPYCMVGWAVVSGLFPETYLVVFITVPMAVALFSRLILFTRNVKDEDLTPRFWMGPMENWAQIKAGGIDWFMFRWLMSRNLLVLFCLIICVLSFI